MKKILNTCTGSIVRQPITILWRTFATEQHKGQLFKNFGFGFECTKISIMCCAIESRTPLVFWKDSHSLWDYARMETDIRASPAADVAVPSILNKSHRWYPCMQNEWIEGIIAITCTSIPLTKENNKVDCLLLELTIVIIIISSPLLLLLSNNQKVSIVRQKSEYAVVLICFILIYALCALQTTFPFFGNCTYRVYLYLDLCWNLFMGRESKLC